jgi:hypothetical protein
MAKFKAKTTPPASEESRREDTVPNMEQAETSSGLLWDAAARFVEGMAGANHEAQKHYRAAWLTYVRALQGALDPHTVHGATQAYAAGIQRSLANQDSREYLETTRQYATAAQHAQETAQTRIKDAYLKWADDLQQAFARATGTRKAELENYVKALQTAFSQADASQVDASMLARMGQATLAAAMLRAHLC